MIAIKSPSVIEAKFRRSNIKAELTYLWKDAPETTRTLISNKITFLGNETPIIIYYLSVNYWWVVTNDRILILNIDTFQIIKLLEIKIKL